MNTKNLNYLNIVLLLGMFFTTYLSNTGKLGGNMMNLAQIFDFKYMPPGQVFGVAWGSIYILHIFWLYELFQKPDRYGSQIFATACCLNILWLVITGGQNYYLAAIVIAVLMRVLWLGISHYKNKKGWGNIAAGSYYGWVSIATVVLTLAQVVFLQNPNFAKSNIFTIFVMILGVCVTYFSYKKNKNIWAVIFSCIGLGGAVLGLLTR